MSTSIPHAKPLAQLDDWDDFVEGRYKEGKSQEEFRVYDAAAQPGVAEFYRLNHEGQTVEYEEVANRGKTSAENLKV